MMTLYVCFQAWWDGDDYDSNIRNTLPRLFSDYMGYR